MTIPATGTAQAAPVVDAVVNGPSDDALDWQSVDWPLVEDSVRRLRQRIFTASQASNFYLTEPSRLA